MRRLRLARAGLVRALVLTGCGAPPPPAPTAPPAQLAPPPPPAPERALDALRTRIGLLPLGPACAALPGEVAHARVRRAQDTLAQEGSTEIGFACDPAAGAAATTCRWTVSVRANVPSPCAPEDPAAAACCVRFALTVELDRDGAPRADTLGCEDVATPAVLPSPA